ncbi:MAG: Mur ligase family protein, partial [Bacillota bacterium]|nr:Mur ligase family protein [Bacillota bacterium]
MRPAVAMEVSLGDLYGRESREFPGFHERLLALLPGLREHHCSRGYPGGFVERLQEGTWLGHVVEHVALELQVEAGYPVRFGRTRQVEGDLFLIVFEHGEEKTGESAGRQALALVEALLAGDEAAARDGQQSFLSGAAEAILGPSTQSLYEAARKRGVPVRRLGGSLLELGHGIHRRRFWGTVADTTSAVAVDLAGHKFLTKERWREWGLPTVEGYLASSPGEALQAFFRLGGPVLVKPALGRQGRGVSGPIFLEAQLREAVTHAAREGWPLLVERYVAGATYRILVVGGNALAAAQRLPPQVVGDGRRTVRELVEAANRHPRRGEGHGRSLTCIPLDEPAIQALADQGYTLESVPPPGEVIYLRFTANLSTGGTARDVTEEIHPGLLALAEKAAMAVGLDIAGVDLIAPSVQGREAVLLEVNASPGLRMHLDPDEGRPRPVGDAIIQHVMGGQAGRIPIAAITGTNGKTTTARLLAHLWSQTGLTVGLAATGAIRIGSRVIWEGDTTGPESA